MKNLKKVVILTSAIIFIGGCETGMKNKSNASDGSKGSSVYSKSSVPKESEIKKIYSKLGTPGYYIQVGYFKEHKPTNEFINRMEFSELPYKLIKKYHKGKVGYYALIGPYRSYKRANEILGSAKDYVTSTAFVLKLSRP